MQTKLVTVLDTGALTTPSLDLNFAALRQLDPRVTFSRASSATFIGPTGLVETAATGVPRFTHDPVTGQSLGLLVEEARTNLVLRSSELNNAYWTKSASTVTADGLLPTGETAYKLVHNAGSGGFLGAAVTVGTSAPITQSVVIKASGYRWVHLNAFDTQQRRAWFDVLDGVLGSVDPGVTSSIEKLANGYFRCTATRTSTAAAPAFAVSIVSANASNALTSDGVSGMTLGAIQVEPGSFATSYIPTTSAAATRAADVATMTGANFSQWYRQDQGTFIVDWAQAYPFASASSATPRLFEVNDGTVNNGWLAYVDTATGQVSFQRENGLPIISFGAVASLNRAAFAYGNGMIYGSLNGGPVVSAASTLPGTLNRLDIGDRFDGLRKRNGPIARLRFFPRVMPAQLQRLTAL